MILAILFCMISILIFGYGVVKAFFKNLSLGEYVVSSVAVGTGLFSLIFFILNQFLNLKFDSLNATFFSSMIFFFGFVLLYFNSELSSERVHLSKLFSRSYEHVKSLFKHFGKFLARNKFFCFLLFIMFVIIIYKSLFFPIINGDGLGFHAPIIRDLYETGYLSKDVGPNTVEFTRAYPPTFFILGAFPSMLNGNYSELFMKGMPFMFGMLTIVCVYLLSKLIFEDEKKALLACLLLMTIPMFTNHNVYLNNDTIFTFFGICAVYFIMKYLKNDNKTSSYLVLAFAILGFAINTKQLGIIFFISLIIPLKIILFNGELKNIFTFNKIWKNIKKIFTGKTLKALCLSIFVFLIIITPYFARNYIYFNDPVYPYLSNTDTFHGKNFSEQLYSPVAEAYAKLNLFYSPVYSLFSAVNYVHDKDYSMSIIFALLLLFVIVSFKKLREEQKYLLYFLIFFTLYFVYTILVKYRYYMLPTAILCVVLAEKFYEFLSFKLSKLEKKLVVISTIMLALAIIAYSVILLYSTKIMLILGPLSVKFLSGLDIVVAMHLVTALAALIVYLIGARITKSAKSNKSKKNLGLLSSIIILIIAIPSLYGLAVINYGITSSATGQIDTSKDMPMFNNRILRLIPDQNAVLEMNFGKDYETQMFIKGNTPKDAVILAYGGITYYSQRQIILIDSYKVASTYSDMDIDKTIDLLHKLNVSYILYKNPGWDEQIFGSGNLYEQSSITRNVRNDDNTQYFKKIYGNGDYTLYEVMY